MKKLRVLALVLAVMLIVGMSATFSGCAAGGNTIKIGAIMPMTGPVSLFGIGTVNAIQIAVKEINDAGGINGKKIEFFYEDDQASPEKAVLAYHKLVSEKKVDAIVGCLTTSCTLAVGALAQADKIPMITGSSTNPKATLVGDYIFRSCFTDTFQGAACGKVAAQLLGKKTAAIVYDNSNEYTIGLADAFEAEFKAEGGTITNKEAYTGTDTDFTAMLTKIKANNPEVLFIPDYYNVVAVMAPQARTLGMTDMVMMGGDGWDGVVQNCGDEIVGCYYLNHFTAGTTDTLGSAFVKKYEEAYKGEKPNALAALGYDAFEILTQAIKTVGSTDHQKVRDAMAATNGDFVTGHIQFDANRNPVKPAVILEVVKGDDGKLADKIIGSIAPDLTITTK